MPCKPENKSYLDSYEVETAKVKANNPLLSDRDVKVQVAQIFRPKFHHWREASKVEDKAAADYKNGEFAFDRNGKMYFPTTGEYTEQMNENQRLLSQLPGHSANEYSLEDHQTSLLIQSTLQSGASRVVTSFGNRDILEYSYDRTTNKGTIRVINTEAEGVNRTTQIKEIAKSKYSELAEIEPKSGIFILSDKPLTVQVAKDTINTVQYAGKQTLKEVGHTISSVRHYIEARSSRKDQAPPVGNKWPIRREGVHDARTLTSNTLKIETARPKGSIRAITREKAIPMVAFSTERRIKRVRIISEMEKSVVRHEKKMKRKKSKTEVGMKTPVIREMHIIKKSEKRKVRLREKRILRKRRMRLIENIIFSKRKIKKEGKLGVKNERRIEVKPRKEKIFSLLLIIKKLAYIKEKVHIRKQDKSEHKQKAKEQVVHFSIAFIMWILLGKPKNVLTNEYKQKKKENKSVVEKEKTSWLLFAIIWHLAMIREQGFVQQRQPKKKKVKKNISYASFAPRGVIFAYAA